jgi:hypothetical protein
MGLAKPQAWALLDPILQQNGGWALFITTPRGRNHAFKSFQLAKKDPDWFGQMIRADQTKVFSAAQLSARSWPTSKINMAKKTAKRYSSKNIFAHSMRSC